MQYGARIPNSFKWLTVSFPQWVNIMDFSGIILDENGWFTIR